MKRIIIVFLPVIFYACNPKPYSATNKIYKKQAKALGKALSRIPKDSIFVDSSQLLTQWIGTTNFGMRKPNYVIVHHTGQQSCEQTIQTFTRQQSQVSAHYLICKDGVLYHMLNDYFRGWHAGIGKWGNETDLNSSSIGIEIDNNGTDSFSLAQIKTLTGLLISLKRKYNIPTANFIGHGDIAPGRKIDPNVHFPWRELAAKGFGLWYADTTNVVVPRNFNDIQGLRIIGYDVSNYEAAIQAFRRHFLNTEQTGILSDGERKIIYMVMQKFL